MRQIVYHKIRRNADWILFTNPYQEIAPLHLSPGDTLRVDLVSEEKQKKLKFICIAKLYVTSETTVRGFKYRESLLLFRNKRGYFKYQLGKLEKLSSEEAQALIALISV